ncbi:TPA: hypothetical protein ACH3X1_015922 [Trebouxia sp. C0004]
MPASSEVEDFTEQVDEACRLIAGLQAGSVSPEEFDRGEAVKVREKAAKEAQQQADRPVLPEQTTERQQQLKQKIAELQKNQQKKQKARQRYNEHVSQQSNKHVTDYTKWDFFTPDDEDDDLINSLTPNNPQLKAMEADIDARHARMVSQRQLAERQRVEGNALYAQGQFTAAFQCYETGLDAERHNMALHGNAAQVLLKMGCHAQAIEHCDKVLHLAEFLHNRSSDPICAKALWRRATARKELKHFSEAYRDLQQALELEPANKAFAKERERLKQDCAEQRKQRAVLKQLHNVNSQSSNASAAFTAKQTLGEQQGRSFSAGEPVKDLQKVQQLMQALHVAANAPSVQQADIQLPTYTGEKLDNPGAPSLTAKGPSGLGKGLPLPASKGSLQSGQNEVKGLCIELTALLHANEDCRVCLRECTGFSTLCNLLLKELGVACPPALRALTAACQNDYNCKDVARQGTASLVAGFLFHSSSEVAFEALCLLYTLTTETEARLAVGQALLKAPESEDTAHISQLFALIAAGNAGTQAMALSLLGNCATQPDVLKAVSTSCDAGGQPVVVTVTKLLSSQDATIATKAATLVGNLCHDSKLQSQITSSRAAVASLLAVLSRHSSQSRLLSSCLSHPGSSVTSPVKHWSALDSPASNNTQSDTNATGRGSIELSDSGTDRLSTQGRANAEAAQAAATALQNLLLDKDAQRLVVDLQGTTIVAKLLSPQNWLLAARAAGCLARLAQQPTSHAAMLSSGTLDDLLQLLAASLLAKDSEDKTWQTQVQDSSARLLATLSASYRPARMHLAQGHGLSLLLQLLRLQACSSAALGNISLCIGDLAREPQLLPVLQQEDAVAPLLDVAYKCKGPTQKNAAIAVARLAHDEACMQRIRELHGLEIIYQYVKP